MATTVVRYPKPYKPGDTGDYVPPLGHECDEYRRAAEHHAGARDFSAAAWYTQLYRLYAPDPPESGLDVECELDWTSG
jgi:hypothetical protein